MPKQVKRRFKMRDRRSLVVSEPDQAQKLLEVNKSLLEEYGKETSCRIAREVPALRIVEGV